MRKKRQLRSKGGYLPFPNYGTKVLNSFFPFISKLWNNLPLSTQCKDLIDFKLQLKQDMKPVKVKHCSKGSKLGNVLMTRFRTGRTGLFQHKSKKEKAFDQTTSVCWPNPWTKHENYMVNGRYVIYSCHSYSISHVIVIICVISCFLFISYGSEIYFIPLFLYSMMTSGQPQWKWLSINTYCRRTNWQIIYRKKIADWTYFKHFRTQPSHKMD